MTNAANPWTGATRLGQRITAVAGLPVPVGARKSVTLRSLRVLPDETAETISPHHPSAGHRSRRLRRPKRRRLTQ
jgi:hypothetical protein